MKRIVILASGSGSNAENIVNFFVDKNVEVVSVLTNKSDAFVLKRAKKLEISSYVFSKNELKTGKVLDVLHKINPDLIVLAGFLLLIPAELIKSFPNKIVNIHPALLPKFGGKGMYGNNVHKAVKDSNEKETGITVHLVNEEYDKGEVIFQAATIISPTDSIEDIANKVHKLEYEHFPRVIWEYLQ